MKPFTMIAVVVFALFALVHVWRLIAGWTVVVADVSIPMWVSIVGVIVGAVLSIMVSREARA